MESACVVCSSIAWKYKCPVCAIKYCSMSCYKEHRENCKEAVDKGNVPASENKENECADNAEQYEFETEDTVKIEKLQRLGKDKKILELLKNSHLCKFLGHLDTCANPSEKIAQAMKDPVFSEYVDACLRVIEGNSDSESSDSE